MNKNNWHQNNIGVLKFSISLIVFITSKSVCEWIKKEWKGSGDEGGCYGGGWLWGCSWFLWWGRWLVIGTLVGGRSMAVRRWRWCDVTACFWRGGSWGGGYLAEIGWLVGWRWSLGFFFVFFLLKKMLFHAFSWKTPPLFLWRRWNLGLHSFLFLEGHDWFNP